MARCRKSKPIVSQMGLVMNLSLMSWTKMKMTMKRKKRKRKNLKMKMRRGSMVIDMRSRQIVSRTGLVKSLKN